MTIDFTTLSIETFCNNNDIQMTKTTIPDTQWSTTEYTFTKYSFEPLTIKTDKLLGCNYQTLIAILIGYFCI